MKKMFNIIVVLAFLSIIVRIGFNFLAGGHTISYQISNDIQVFTVVETFYRDYKSLHRNESDTPNYFFEIYLKGEPKPTFVFKMLGNVKFNQRLITDIKYFENDNTKCIYPILKIEDYNNDVLCFDGANMVYYNTIKGKYADIDAFVNRLHTEYKYTNPSWLDTADEIRMIGDIEVYGNNINSNHIIALWNYNGVRTVTKNDSFASILLLRDNYDNELGILVDRFYVTPNYSKRHSFNKFIILDITNNSKKEIELSKEISIDSYIQGVVNNKLYIFDKTSNIQYQINPLAATIIEVGNIDDGIRFYDGEWSIVSVPDIAGERKFEINYEIPEILKQYTYTKIDSVLGDKDGYYYIYRNVNNKTRIYRADKQRPEYLTFLFETTNISNVKYVDNYLYFINGDTIYVYHETIGLKPVIRSFELLFNKNNVYDVYSK